MTTVHLIPWETVKADRLDAVLAVGRAQRKAKYGWSIAQQVTGEIRIQLMRDGNYHFHARPTALTPDFTHRGDEMRRIDLDRACEMTEQMLAGDPNNEPWRMT